ncbi:PepSY-associated TM helix domain-containing protein [Granulicella sp. dw_53]|uniref:PepSY-associated TM helix domain-containing protein n=1 Tax=Granulicella sp. dw_53 TaxID=2719792 RepID=UPI001BD4248D|nr:PepSY-associated TM helix domain-containing protein [Granulicella sp. dw_53]
MGVRRLLFWAHLIVGLVVGFGVAYMAATGSILAFQPQIIRFAERNITPSLLVPGEICVAPSTLLTAAQAQSRRTATSIQFFSDPRLPAQVTLQNNATLLVDACTGKVLGEGASRLRIFFNSVRDLHRWVALSRGQNEGLRAVKDAANLGFFFLLLSGLVLWVPRQWRAANLKSAMTFRKKMKGRAREWNLHNIAGFWLALPLLVISSTGSVMAYGWANDLMYRAAGTPLPPRAPERQVIKGSLRDLTLLDPLVARAKQQDPHWYSLLMRLPGEKDKSVTFSVDEGLGGRPEQRAQLVIGLKDAKVMRWEPFSNQSRGRQWRLYTRYLHTGEMYGVVGELVAMIAALAGLVLVWTGFSLATRRLIAWRRRTAKSARTVSQELVSSVPSMSSLSRVDTK